jgi:hypothetical protein
MMEKKNKLKCLNKKNKPSFLSQMDEEMDTTASLPTTEQVLDAEITLLKADKGQPMFNQENG